MRVFCKDCQYNEVVEIPATTLYYCLHPDAIREDWSGGWVIKAEAKKKNRGNDCLDFKGGKNTVRKYGHWHTNSTHKWVRKDG